MLCSSYAFRSKWSAAVRPKLSAPLATVRGSVNPSVFGDKYIAGTYTRAEPLNILPQFRPENVERFRDAFAERDRDILFVRDYPGRVGARNEPRVAKESGKIRSSAVAVDVDHQVSTVAVRSPEPVIVVARERRR